jgi:hypothetical protein
LAFVGISLVSVASGLFFVYCAALAVAEEPARRNRVLIGCTAGAAGTVAWVAWASWPVLHDWVLPPLILLTAYWTSGALFKAPSPAWERRLMDVDRRLDIRSRSARAPRAVAEFLELSYAGVYPLIPVALILHLTLTPEPDVDRFWAVVLVTDYICFALLPWIQTRPPRALEEAPPWRSSFRHFNARLLGTASIGVNTFPSGHAAEALAAALLVWGAPAPVVAWMFFNAAAIAAGAVFGRYHYAADAIAGYAVALAVWLLL